MKIKYIKNKRGEIWRVIKEKDQIIFTKMKLLVRREYPDESGDAQALIEECEEYD